MFGQRERGGGDLDQRLSRYPRAISLRMPVTLETLSSMSSIAGAW